MATVALAVTMVGSEIRKVEAPLAEWTNDRIAVDGAGVSGDPAGRRQFYDPSGGDGNVQFLETEPGRGGLPADIGVSGGSLTTGKREFLQQYDGQRFQGLEERFTPQPPGPDLFQKLGLGVVEATTAGTVAAEVAVGNVSLPDGVRQLAPLLVSSRVGQALATTDPAVASAASSASYALAAQLLNGDVDLGRIATGAVTAGATTALTNGLQDLGVGSAVSGTLASLPIGLLTGQRLDNLVPVGIKTVGMNLIKSAITSEAARVGTAAGLGALRSAVAAGAPSVNIAAASQAASSAFSAAANAVAIPAVGIILDGILGNDINPSSVLGQILGGAIGGPLGGLIGGFVGSLVSGLFGWGGPKSFTIASDIDIDGDGTLDSVEGRTRGTNYRYKINDPRNLPIRTITYEFVEKGGGYTSNYYQASRTRQRMMSEGQRRTPREFYVGVQYEYEPLFAATGTGIQSEMIRFPDSDDSRTRQRMTTSGFRVTEEQYVELMSALADVSAAANVRGGGPSRLRGSISGGDPRVALFRPFQERMGGVDFDQEHVSEGLYSKTDVNGDGALDTVRSFPNINKFVEGDGRTEIVEWGFPKDGLISVDVTGDGIADLIQVTPDADGDGSYDTVTVLTYGRAPTTVASSDTVPSSP